MYGNRRRVTRGGGKEARSRKLPVGKKGCKPKRKNVLTERFDRMYTPLEIVDRRS